MNRITFFSVLIWLFIQVNSYAQIAPDFTATDVNGIEHTLYPTLSTERTIILNFFFLGCLPCEYYLPDLVELEAEYGGTTGGLEIWVLSKLDESAALSEFASENGYPFYFFGVDGGAFEAITAYEYTFDTIFYPNYTVVCPDASATFDIWPVTDNIWEIESVVLQCNFDVGVSDLPSESPVIYPNPAGNILFYSNPTHADHITITSADGRLMKSIEGNAPQILIADLPFGVYLFSAYYQGNLQISELFIKK